MLVYQGVNGLKIIKKKNIPTSQWLQFDWAFGSRKSHQISGSTYIIIINMIHMYIYICDEYIYICIHAYIYICNNVYIYIYNLHNYMLMIMDDDVCNICFDVYMYLHTSVYTHSSCAR